MATGQIVTNIGKKIVMHRTFESAPTLTAPRYFKVGTGTNTPSLVDTDLQTAITIGGATKKAFVSGYPVLNDSNLEITTRCILLSTECNGNNITEFGIVNNDTSPLLFSRSVFNSITKTASVQVIFVEKDLIQ